MSKKKHRSKRKKRKLRSLPLHSAASVSDKKVGENIPLLNLKKIKEEKREDNQEMLPLTYPPAVLKKDLLRTLIISLFILVMEVGLYYYDKTHNLVNLLTHILR